MLPFHEFVKTIDPSVTKKIRNNAIQAATEIDSEPDKTIAISYATTLSLLELYYNWYTNQ